MLDLDIDQKIQLLKLAIEIGGVEFESYYRKILSLLSDSTENKESDLGRDSITSYTTHGTHT